MSTDSVSRMNPQVLTAISSFVLAHGLKTAIIPLNKATYGVCEPFTRRFANNQTVAEHNFWCQLRAQKNEVIREYYDIMMSTNPPATHSEIDSACKEEQRKARTGITPSASAAARFAALFLYAIALDERHDFTFVVNVFSRVNTSTTDFSYEPPTQFLERMYGQFGAEKDAVMIINACHPAIGERYSTPLLGLFPRWILIENSKGSHQLNTDTSLIYETPKSRVIVSGFSERIVPRHPRAFKPTAEREYPRRGIQDSDSDREEKCDDDHYPDGELCAFETGRARQYSAYLPSHTNAHVSFAPRYQNEKK